MTKTKSQRQHHQGILETLGTHGACRCIKTYMNEDGFLGGKCRVVVCRNKIHKKLGVEISGG